ncbi:MAG TPA: SDR family oxidoreductase [Polyangiaceae bacterium LLY-WYZ-14_1]|nr:SDR family oxidoreductase [Polyangiaceae bacterium LLY-WYZ-14_1]
MTDDASPVHLVFGGTGGIGAELARQLHARRARLMLVARGEDRLKALAQELDVPWTTGDAREPDDVQAAVDATVERFGRVDGIANLVGSVLLKPAHLTTPEELAETIALNLTSAFNVVRSGTKAMMRQGGSIVLMATAAARTGLPNHEGIAAAKGGVLGLTLAAAATYASKRIRINAVAPGLVETPLTERIVQNETSRKASLDMHPLGRLGRPEDIAPTIAWLLGDESRWVTGQTIGLDGGVSTVRPR